MAIAAATLLAGCGDSGGGGGTVVASNQPASVPQLTVTSTDVESGTVPRELTCDGGNRAPSFSVAAIPAGAKAMALEMLDPDAPSGSFTHWLAFVDGPPAATIAGFPSRAAIQGKNDKGTNGYTGPCPPSGPPHHYHVMVFALDFSLGEGGAGLTPGFTRAQLEAAIKSNRSPVVARGDLVATYARP